ncbi:MULTISPECIES: hypothetical protein [Pseudomonas]|uniref:hypothetical protein n=1 Tax=Pseudomonas TaxID=286 RepID=UPI0018E6EF58|nr:hypothetical protein [Pseudomonas sp. MF7453]MBJ2217608.1 hypothetical protein [Pseudomonas sp. MF7453]
MTEPLNINIRKFQRPIGDTKSIATFESGSGVTVQIWDGNAIQYQQALTHEEYDKFRERVPEYELPDYPHPNKENPVGGTNSNGNTLGRVVGETASTDVPAAQANPSVDNETDEETSTTDKVLDGVQLGLDVASLVPGLGIVTGGASAAISIVRGDYTGAATSALAMIPFAGGVVKGGVLVGKHAGKLERASSKIGRGQAKAKGRSKCILRPYKINGKSPCTPLTGHHVVPDRAFRLGNPSGPDRIPGGLNNSEGLVICVRGKGRQDEHGRIHKYYDADEHKLALISTPKGTAPLIALETLGAKAASKVTGCRQKDLLLQLRTYHQAKGMGPDFIVRADPYGRFAKTIPKEIYGSKSSGGPGSF